MTHHIAFGLLLAVCAGLLSGCGLPSGAANPGAHLPAAAYCTQNGGTLETRYPFYGTNDSNPLQLAGSMQVCVFTSQADNTRILIAVDTLYAEQPTLAASAYLAKPPLKSVQSSGNPSSIYCSQLGGTDQFGGVNASGGGWAKVGAADAIAMCIFPDLSAIDSWGLTYHSDGTIRGADLTNLLRHKPPQAPHVYS